MTTTQHRKFDLGFNRDEASWLTPEGYCYSSKNMLFDKIGIVRKRGGLTGVGATTTYNGDRIGTYAETGNVRIYGMGSLLATPGNSNPFYYNSSTGVQVDLNGAADLYGVQALAGRPFVHHEFLIWPLSAVSNGTGVFGLGAVAGATGSKANYNFVTPGSVTTTAGSPIVGCAAADGTLAAFQDGRIFTFSNAAGASGYIGRVKDWISTTAFTVWPTPTITVGAGVTAASLLNATPAKALNAATFGNAYVGGRVGMSFQGRVCVGNCTRTTGLGTQLAFYPRRVWFTSTLLEADAVLSTRYQGAVWMTPDGFPDANYFDIPGNDGITAMSPTAVGEAVIFTAYRTYRVTGNLSTQFGTSQSVTWAVREVPNSVGCISEASMRRTPRGVVFAHDSGIYVTDGISMQPLMNNRISAYWRGLLTGGGFVIYGSALIGNHYYICGFCNSIAGGFWSLLLNLDTLAWGTLAGKTTTPASWIISGGEQDPVTPSKVWGFKWWDQTAAAPSMTGGLLVNLEAMFLTGAGTRDDGDGTRVNFEYVSRPYTEDSPTMQKIWQSATIQYNLINATGTYVTPLNVLDAARATTPVNTANSIRLGDRQTFTVTGVSINTPTVITIGSHTIDPDDWVWITGVVGPTTINGLWRVISAGGTTISVAGPGSGAYVSGGTVTVVDTKEIALNIVPQAAGSDSASIVYRISDNESVGGSGVNSGAETFELYGITHSYEERDPHVE